MSRDGPRRSSLGRTGPYLHLTARRAESRPRSSGTGFPPRCDGGRGVASKRLGRRRAIERSVRARRTDGRPTATPARAARDARRRRAPAGARRHRLRRQEPGAQQRRHRGAGRPAGGPERHRAGLHAPRPALPPRPRRTAAAAGSHGVTARLMTARGAALLGGAAGAAVTAVVAAVLVAAGALDGDERTPPARSAAPARTAPAPASRADAVGGSVADALAVRRIY